ncbi:hypothetical protein ACNRWW_12535 [Metabacillus sp. HB246100]|uniref:hypothetical protein n=1 Tax=Bacillus weihaiensis TaxID=1547283 RepID=UPI0023540CAB|nr:hypothetical protein [Bacillus weihaiensis]
MSIYLDKSQIESKLVELEEELEALEKQLNTRAQRVKAKESQLLADTEKLNDQLTHVISSMSTPKTHEQYFRTQTQTSCYV